MPVSSPLRVAVVTDGLYPYFKGGKEVRLHHLLPSFTPGDIKVEVYTMCWWGRGGRRPDTPVPMHSLCPAIPMYAGSRRSIVQAVVFSISCLRLLTVRTDLIDADHMPYFPVLVLKAVARAKRIPLVVTWHEWWGSDYWETYLGRLGRVGAIVEQVAARSADHLVVETEDTARRLRGAGIDEARISVLPLGIDTDALDAVEPGEPHDVLFAGRLIEHKGAHTLIEALRLLDMEGFAPTTAIVGEGPEMERLRSMVKKSRLEGTVKFLGRMEGHNDVFALMKAARVFVLPTRREGYGLAVAEALACGTPVITTNHADNHARYLVDHGTTGLLCDPDAPSLAIAIKWALAEPILASPAASAGRGWKDMADRLAAIYRDRCAA